MTQTDTEYRELCRELINSGFNSGYFDCKLDVLAALENLKKENSVLTTAEVILLIGSLNTPHDK